MGNTKDTVNIKDDWGWSQLEVSEVNEFVKAQAIVNRYAAKVKELVRKERKRIQNL